MDKHTIFPASWTRYIKALPILQDVIHWQPLRQWGLSEVWRITTTSGQTWIAKQSHGSMTVELTTYQQLLRPLGIKQPKIHSFIHNATDHCFIMEDLGAFTLEQQPQEVHFLESARVLARLRINSMHALQQSSSLIPASYFVSPTYFLQTLANLLQHPQLDSQAKHDISSATTNLPSYLQELYALHPLTLNHNDYHVKNIILHNNTVVPIDWTMANISPHHGDLYTLLRGATFRNFSRDSVLSAYLDEENRLLPSTEHLHRKPLEWQISVGTLCILIISIHWILTEAQHHLPGSLEWLPRMIQNMLLSADKLNTMHNQP